MDLLRFSTAGSVDDGKSTLIGRLLYDSKGIFEDQLEAVTRASKQRLATGIDLSLLTDGLRAEREQGITIDVAYRYFATPRRKFIIADTPGHEQYTRNMATGASTADLAIILIDARKGVLDQSRRHSAISALLGIPHVCVAVNKMDLVGWSRDVFDKIRQDYLDLAAKLGIADPAFIPLSALLGGNVVDRAEETPWYDGPTLLEHLETVPVPRDHEASRFRFPVQYVIRPDLTFRGFAGRIASGSISVGDEVEVVASGRRSRVRQLHTFDGDLPSAGFPKSVAITLQDEVDISRGDILVRAGDAPARSRDFEANVVWMSEKPLALTRPYLIQQGSRTVRGRLTRVVYRTDIKTLEDIPSSNLGLNDIGRVRVQAQQPILLDPYPEYRDTGCFILIDPETNATVAAGMIARDQPRTSSDVVWSESEVTRATREHRQGHRGAVLWFTGLSGSGKSTIAKALEKILFLEGRTVFLHGRRQPPPRTQQRPGLRSAELVPRTCAGPRRWPSCSWTPATWCWPRSSPPPWPTGPGCAASWARSDFLEIHVSTPLEICEKRDPKGLYARARSGEIAQFTGVSAPWEPPSEPDLDLPAHLLLRGGIHRADPDPAHRAGIFLGAALPGGGGI
jgi:bifunctional enzyme CysN/CysC